MPPPQARPSPSRGARPRRDSPTANPPVCRIMDFGGTMTRNRSARARPAAPESDRGQGDQVPPEGRRARLPVQEEAHRALPRGGRQGQGDDLLRGREMAHPEIGRRILERLVQELAEVAVPRRCPGWRATRCTPSWGPGGGGSRRRRRETGGHDNRTAAIENQALAGGRVPARREEMPKLKTHRGAASGSSGPRAGSSCGARRSSSTSSAARRPSASGRSAGRRRSPTSTWPSSRGCCRINRVRFRCRLLKASASHLDILHLSV